MLPRWHILFGALFGLFLWLVWPQIPLYEAIISFMASVFIDFDHYLSAGYHSGRWGLFDSFEYYRREEIKERLRRARGIRMKRDFQVFHTIEFHLIILTMGIFVWPIFLWIFLECFFILY